MCMSPDEMSDDRLREAIGYYREAEQMHLADGDDWSASRYRAQVDNFEALLKERHTARVAEIDEAMASVTAETPARETVRV